jgi:hypothetical protein
MHLQTYIGVLDCAILGLLEIARGSSDVEQLPYSENARVSFQHTQLYINDIVEPCAPDDRGEQQSCLE